MTQAWSLAWHGLSNRELAAGTLLLFLFVGAVFWPVSRASLASVIKTLLSWKILVVFGSYLVVVIALAICGYRFHVWDWSLAFPTLTWYIFGALPLSMKAGAEARGAKWMSQALKPLLSLAAVFAMVTGARSFTLTAEMVLWLVLGTLGGIGGGMSVLPEGKSASKVFLWPAYAISGWLIISNLVWLLQNRNAADWPGLMRGAAMPLWMTPPISMLTLCWASLFSYELVWMRLGFSEVKSPSRTWKFLLVLRAVSPRPSVLGAFSGGWTSSLGKTQSEQAARDLIRLFKAEHSAG